MGQFRTCQKCKVARPITEFEDSKTIWCKSCSLVGKRMLAKFAAMVESPITGLADLDLFLDGWYVIA